MCIRDSPDGVGVGLEINRTARVFPSFQNMNNGIGVPVVRISGFSTWGANALSPFIGSRVEHLFRLQEFGDLHRPSAFHTQLKDTLDHKSGCLVHNPLCSILRVFAVAKGDIGCQRDALLALGLLYRTNLAACLLYTSSKMHNNSNVLAFGARVVGSEMAKMITEEWLDAKYEGGRHQRRVDMLMEIENR